MLIIGTFGGDVFDVCWPELSILNRLHAILPKDYQCGSLQKLWPAIVKIFTTKLLLAS